MTKNNSSVEGPDGLVYTARLPLSSTTLNWLADLIRGHLKKIGSRWRALPAGKIATIVLAVLRCDQRPGDLAGGNGAHRTTVTRWVREVVGLLAARAPRLDRALKKIARMGGGIVLLDGSVIRTRRRTGKENRKNYSGKNKCHGLLVITLTDDRGRLLWISAARPGRTSEITACRHDKPAAVECFAQKGFYGTTTHEIADWVGISQPYLYRLYPNKEALFAAVVDHVSVVMTETLVAHPPASGGAGPAPEAALDAARGAYAALVADRNILRFLMHANCAAGEPLVAQAVRRCYAKQVDTVRQLLGDDNAVRRWFGAGMLDNVATVLGLADIDEPWAHVLTAR